VTDLKTQAEPAPSDVADTSPTVVWLPPEEPPKKRHLALWLGIPGGLVAATAAVCAVVLIAPGVLVAGEDVGWHTPGVASAVVADALSQTVVTFETPSRDITLTGEQLGLSVDAKAISALAHGDYPLWKVGSWNPGNVPIAVDVDGTAALAALSAAAPQVFPAPVDATVAYDPKLAEFTTVNSDPGLGVNFDALATTVSEALSSGARTVTFDAKPVDVQAAVSTAEARQQASTLNELIDSAGFYVDDKKVVPIAPADAASWISVSVKDDALAVEVDTDAALADIKKVVATLGKTVDRPAVDEIIVTNSAGDHLRTVQNGADGWKLASVAGVAAGFVESFAAGDGTYDLEVKQQAYKTTLAMRTIEVNKTTGQAILFENGRVVDTYAIAIGRPETPTFEGHFTVYGQLPLQDMGCVPGYDYCTKDVPWISYFDGDNGFHGTYWHDNFGAGAMMSHGCVNMTIAAAERVFRFAQIGTEVWVHS
jgi:lipoprotein-anchoring transpeptidase ErfK/SrfK